MKTDKNSGFKKSYIIIIIIVIILPVIAMFFFLDYKEWNINKIESSIWLQFFGSYLGGVLGGLATLLALAYSINNFREEIKLNREIIEENKKENNRQKISEIRPYIKLYDKVDCPKEINHRKGCRVFITSEEIKSKVKLEPVEHLYASVPMKNVGNGLALNIRLESSGNPKYYVFSFNDGITHKESYDLAKGEGIVLDIDFVIVKPTPQAYTCDIECDLIYEDIMGNVIKQRISIRTSKKQINSATVGYDNPRYNNPKIDSLLNFENEQFDEE